MYYILLGVIATFFTYLLTLIGAASVFFIKKINNKLLDYILGLSSGIMIAASFFSLLLPAINLLTKLNRLEYIETSIGFAGGCLLIILSDIILGRKKALNEDNKKSILLVSAVTLHNFPEGLVIGVAFGSLALNSNLILIDAILIAVGIGIQNLPEGACTALPLRKAGYTRKKAFVLGQASGLVEIIAGLIGAIFVITIENSLPFFLSFSAGAMILVCASELIPDAFKNNKKLASIGLASGFIIMMFLDIALS